MHRILLRLVLLLTVAACASTTTYSVTVSSIADPTATSFGTYTMIPLDESMTHTDLQFQEYARYVRSSLPRSMGLYVEPDADPEAVVILAYGIGDPATEVSSFAIPQFGQTGISSAQTYGTVSSYGNYGTYSGTTNFTPTYGITGYTTHVASQRTYQRHISLFAYDLRSASSEPRQVWQTVIQSRGTNGDLRSVFPVMIAAASPSIARNANESVSIDIDENDPKVSSLKALSQ